MNKKVNYYAYKIAGQKYKIYFYMIFISFILAYAPIITVCLIAPDSITDLMPVLMPITTLLFSSFFVFLILFMKISSLKKSLRTLSKADKLEYAEEIASGNYNTNGRFCFSEHFLYDNKKKIILAYDDIIWIYIRKNGFLQEKVFRTIDGKEYVLEIDDFILNEFIKRQRHINLGYTPENIALYNIKVKEFKTQKKLK